jgi:hypothetical protein
MRLHCTMLSECLGTLKCQWPSYTLRGPEKDHLTKFSLPQGQKSPKSKPTSLLISNFLLFTLLSNSNSLSTAHIAWHSRGYATSCLVGTSKGDNLRTTVTDRSFMNSVAIIKVISHPFFLVHCPQWLGPGICLPPSIPWLYWKKNQYIEHNLHSPFISTLQMDAAHTL